MGDRLVAVGSRHVRPAREARLLHAVWVVWLHQFHRLAVLVHVAHPLGRRVPRPRPRPRLQGVHCMLRQHDDQYAQQDGHLHHPRALRPVPPLRLQQPPHVTLQRRTQLQVTRAEEDARRHAVGERQEAPPGGRRGAPGGEAEREEDGGEGDEEDEDSRAQLKEHEGEHLRAAALLGRSNVTSHSKVPLPTEHHACDNLLNLHQLWCHPITRFTPRRRSVLWMLQFNYVQHQLTLVNINIKFVSRQSLGRFGSEHLLKLAS